MQPLDFVEPGVEFLTEMLAQFRRKFKSYQLDQVFVDRVRQPVITCPTQSRSAEMAYARESGGSKCCYALGGFVDQ
jgi:hypothetical protein